MNTICIGKRIIGEGHPCFIIAEIGVNHNGDVNLAKKMIDAAILSGADAVKFQTWITEETIVKNVPKPLYQKLATGYIESQYDMVKKLELDEQDFKVLAEYADRNGIEFLSTPEGITCTDWLDTIGVNAYKVSSPDLVNHPDLAYIAQKSKPVILSTGMATLKEIRDAVNIIREQGNQNIILLHCTSSYPTNPEDANLNAILTLKKKFKLPVGYSDHTVGTLAAGIAVALGACVIEKHFTLDKTLQGPDHQASLEPDEFRAMVDTVRLTEKYLGSFTKKPVPAEHEMLHLSRKYLVAGCHIKKGEEIHREDIVIKKTGNGIHLPTFLNIKKIVGTRARKDYFIDDPI